MKPSKIIACLLTVVFIFSCSGCGIIIHESEQPSEDVFAVIDKMNVSELSKQELYCAAKLGMPMNKVAQKTLSGEEFTELLDWFVKYTVPNKQTEWANLYPELRSSKVQIKRIDAMLALFLSAEFVGGDYSGYPQNVWQLLQSINHDWESEDSCFTDSLFGEASNTEYKVDTIGSCVLVAAGFYYNMARKSNYSNLNPFPLDTSDCTYQLGKQVSYADGILAVFRLLTSTDSVVFEREPTETEQHYTDMADTRRDEITDAITDLTAKITGTVYYVSNSGSDSNDGLSPETAWATVKYALRQPLEVGDAVLLERGSEWTVEPSDKYGLTSSAYIVPEGVTLGAYGSGEKPVIQGSSVPANETNFWKLYSENGGTKIWKATQSVRYCPSIVFNDGASYASPVMPYMNESCRYVNDDGSYFDVNTGLEKDLQFCCLLDLSDTGININIENTPVKGELFLRCDAGNPAEIFTNIHIPQTACGLALLTNASIDGIALRYFTCDGAVLDGYDGFHSQSANNCEVGWCGGLLKMYDISESGVYAPVAAGGALQASSTNVSVTNSYFHDCGPFTLITVFHNNAENPPSCILQFENIYISGNLIERCGSGVHMGDYATMDIPDTYGSFSDYVFENNMVINSGFGWAGEMISKQRGSASAQLSAFESFDSASDNYGIYIRNNVFFKSAYALFSLSEYRLDGVTPVNTLPVFSGNTYIQYAGNPLIQKNQYTQAYYPSSETMKEVLGDNSGTLVVIE